MKLILLRNTFFLVDVCLPSVFSISKSMATQTKMQVISLEDIGKHDVSRLSDWHNKLLANKLALLAQGFTDNFIGMWQFYFCYSATGLESNESRDIHALWRKRI